MRKRVLVLDIDGTLTNSKKEITVVTKQAIQGLMQRDYQVILASGRPTAGMRRYEEELELEKYGGYLLSFNGAKVIECRSGEVVYQRLLPLTFIPGLYDFAKKNHCGLITYLGDEVISAFPIDKYVEIESRINGIPVRRVENFVDFVDFDINKCLMTAEPARATILVEQLKEKYGDVASICRSEPYFIEIMPQNVNKATSLDRMLQAIGRRREETVCCGDGFNDISMLEYAGVGVAMGNAQEEVKKIADYVTGTNDEDGLVEVIEKFFPEKIRIEIPEKANYVIHTIQAAGYEAYAVGGCVRDSILGRKPQDWDITTSATPWQIKELFPRTIDTGLQHGTVTVMVDKEGFEVTTYRIDGAYEDGRHPSEVIFTPNLEEDLKRRDFTINAMAYNEEKGLVDLYGGLKDIELGIIRCVGNPMERFGEDALRILRAIRFSAQLGYEMEEKTVEAIRELAPTLEKISAERIQAELLKLLVSPHPEYLRQAYEMGVTKVFLPEFDRAMETPQKHPHHKYGVGEHILHSMENIEPDRVLRLTMLLHDIGKPEALTVDEKGITHFYGHAAISADMAKTILRRLKMDNDTISRVCRLVQYHDYANHLEPDIRLVRRAVNKIGEDAFPALFSVKRADILAQSEYMREEKLERLEKWKVLYQEIQEKKQCVSLKELAVTGSDLIGEGFPPGKEIGMILQELLELVLEEPERNNREWLLQKIREERRF